MNLSKLHQIKRFSIGLGLLVLALGFSSIGILSFLNEHPENKATGLFSEATYSIIGSYISILVGAMFLGAAIFFAGTLLRAKRSLRT